jgi:hemerythrin-like metal-binding protein
MTMIEWTSALSTGVPLLDEHHQTIFQWLAELENAATEERTLFGVYALTRLRHYAREHFAAEETLMKACGYAELAEHVAEHIAFRAKLEKLHLQSIGTDISTDTIAFLRDWLTHHITITDMAYVPCLRKLDIA